MLQMTNISSDVSKLRGELSNLNQTTASLQQSVTSCSQDVSQAKSDITTLRQIMSKFLLAPILPAQRNSFPCLAGPKVYWIYVVSKRLSVVLLFLLESLRLRNSYRTRYVTLI